MLALGIAYVSSLGLWEIARPHLEALVGRTGESSSMAQLDGSDIVYVARVSVPKIIALRVDIGTRFPAAPTSQGKVLLAALDPAASTPRSPSRAGPGCRRASAGPRGRPATTSWRGSGPRAGRWPTRSSPRGTLGGGAGAGRHRRRSGRR